MSLPMRYAIWNNKGGVGKSFLSFILGTEYAHAHPDETVLLVDMCPQANLSEMILGGNGNGAAILQGFIEKRNRQTIGWYFDTRIESPHRLTDKEDSYRVNVSKYNDRVPENLWLIVGDPSLELQAQVISQIAGQTLPVDTWKNVHSWLKDLIVSCETILGETKVFIDCNPSFSAYTELAMIAAERLIVPCSSDGSSARAIDNIGALLFGIDVTMGYRQVNFASRAKRARMPYPTIHSVLLNRSTLYSEKASKAFEAMFDEIKKRTRALRRNDPSRFVFKTAGEIFHVIPDNHSVAIVCSHLGRPLYSIVPGNYKIHGTNPRINPEPLDRYKLAMSEFRKSLD